MKETRKPSLGEAFVPIIFMMVIIIVGTIIWGIEPHVPIVLACIVAALMAVKCGHGAV